MMQDLDSLTPAQYRARYESLQAAARALAATAPPHPGPPPADAAVLARGTLPPGAYIPLRLAQGHALRLINPAGTPGAALFLWRADDPAERFNAADTIKVQWTTNLTTGRVLFSDMGRVLATITADSGAGHDAVIGPNGPARHAAPNAPARHAAPNGRDNLRLAAAKFGLTRRDLGPALSLFSSVRTDHDGRLHFTPPPAGAMVELRAEMPLWLALSNTPHALSPVATATGPLDYIIHEAPALDRSSLSPEAQRAFENNDAYGA
jgi:urea carboxylase-associated protein 2